MSAGQELLELIQCLNPSERRYFRIHSKKHESQGNMLYFKVFTAIEKMEKWDEPTLIQEVKSDELQAQLPVIITYVQKLVLRNLRNFHSGKSVDFRLKEHLMNVELLLSKSLSGTAQKELGKVKRLALRFEKFEYLPEILSHEISLSIQKKEGNLGKINAELNQLIEDSQTYFRKFMNILIYKKLSFQMLLLNRAEQSTQSKNSQEAYRKLFAEPIFAETGNPESIKAEIFLNQSMLIFNMSSRNFRECFENSERIIQLMEAHPVLVEENPENYLASFQNLITMSLNAKPLSYTMEVLSKFKGIAEGKTGIKYSKGAINNARFFAWFNELTIYLDTEDYSKGLALANEISLWLSANEKPEGINVGYMVHVISFNISRIYLHTNNLKEAGRHLNKILNSESMGPQFELFMSTRLLQLILYFELGEFSLIESIAASIQRQWSKKGGLHKAESILINFLKRVDKNPATKEWGALKNELDEELANLPAPSSFSHAGVIRWLHTKLQKL